MEMQPPIRLNTKVLRVAAFLLFTASIGVGCSLTDRNSRTLTSEESKLVGEWFSGNGYGTYVIKLQPNGRYTAVANGCFNDSGSGSGNWEVADGFVLFHPRKEWGDVEGLRTLAISERERTFLLKTDPFSMKMISERGPARNSAYKKDTWW